MLIQAHVLPRASYGLAPLGTSLHYPYEQIRPETWGENDRFMPCWSTRTDGLNFGMRWSQPQRQALKRHPLYKTYELHNVDNKEWVGIERAGHLLPEGFLPLRVTYRRQDGVTSLVMPGNVGYLYAYLNKQPYRPDMALAPNLQFIRDIDVISPGGLGSNYYYHTVQQIVPVIIQNGPHLAVDIRDVSDAYEEIRIMSQNLDMLGNHRWNSDERLQDWISEHVILEAPFHDRVIYHYPNGPIPLQTLQQWYVHTAVIDRTVPSVLQYPKTAQRVPPYVMQLLLGIGITDLWMTFAIRWGVLDFEPLSCFAQNRFGAYVPIELADDKATARSALSYLWSNYRQAGMLDGLASLQVTANDEAKLCLVDMNDNRAGLTFYADLNDVTDAWLGVTQPS